MKVRQLMAVLAVAGLAGPLAAQAQEHGDAEMAAMMEAYEKAGTPGENHRILDRMVGEWDIEVRMYMDPSGEPQVSHGTAVTKWVMAGRFVEETVQGDFMGAPFQGRGLTGYNNVTGEYEATWIDNHTTAIVRYTGEVDDQGRMIFMSKYKDPTSGEMVKGRSVAEFVSDDEVVYRAYEDRGEGETLTMELIYTRKM